MDSKAITKVTKQRIIVSKPKDEIKWKHENIQLNQKEAEKEKKEPRINGINRKQIASFISRFKSN